MTTVPARLGQVNGAGDVQAMFLKIFAGEILAEFERTNAFKDRHYIRTIKEGKSAAFPMIGTASASYHTVGQYIDGGQIGTAEQVITIDDLLQANVTIPKIDEAMNHFDVRQPFSQELGRALSKQFDQNVAKVGILAARASSPLTGRPGGSRLTNANMATDGAVLEAALYSAQQTLDEKDIPEADRAAFFKPLQYYTLAQREKLVSKDYGGNGSIGDGVINTVAGLPIVKTNNIPTTNVTTGPTKYQGNFSGSVGLIMNKMAVGTCKLLDLGFESEYEIRHQATFMVAKYLLGHGILRPDCAVELATS